MPSPVGHVLAGVSGFLLARNYMAPRQQKSLLVGSVVNAVLPDLDVVPGLVLLGDPGALHHQATHSIPAAVMAALVVGYLARCRNANGVWWGMWGCGVYLSHAILDLFVDDSTPPFGVQLL